MLEFAHAFTGGIIVYKTKSFLFLPLSLLSHFILDLFPHWNPSLGDEIQKYHQIRKKTLFLLVSDSLFGLFLGLFLAFKTLPSVRDFLLVILGCLAGILPDLIEAPYYFFNLRSKFLEKIVKFQSDHQFNVAPILGICFQILYIFLLFQLIK